MLPEVPCHITQRGVDRRETFSGDDDRKTYLRLLRENLDDAGVSILGWCLMTNHVHVVAVPARKESLSVLFRRVHGRYAQYYNARWGRTGHLWQNRFFGCELGPGHLWAALAYVERNPARAGMVEEATEYAWSSAAAHVTGEDRFGVLDMEWWRRECVGRPEWSEVLKQDDEEAAAALRRCTYAGRPFGEQDFVNSVGEQFGRTWTRGRPKKRAASAGAGKATSDTSDQFKLFG